MEVVWADGPCTARPVADRLAGRGLAYTTWLTVLGRLEGKGLLRRDRAGAGAHLHRRRLPRGPHRRAHAVRRSARPATARLRSSTSPAGHPGRGRGPARAPSRAAARDREQQPASRSACCCSPWSPCRAWPAPPGSCAPPASRCCSGRRWGWRLGLLAIEVAVTLALSPLGADARRCASGRSATPTSRCGRVRPWRSAPWCCCGCWRCCWPSSAQTAASPGGATARLVDLVATRNPLLRRHAGRRPRRCRWPTACPGCGRASCCRSGVLALLSEDEVRAVLAHESAHLDQRHDLVVLPFVALRATFPWLQRGADGSGARSPCSSRCWPTTAAAPAPRPRRAGPGALQGRHGARCRPAGSPRAAPTCWRRRGAVLLARAAPARPSAAAARRRALVAGAVVRRAAAPRAAAARAGAG